LYLIDCGEGTQMQMRKNKVRFGKINHIFISHLHGDHVFGLYGLLSTFNLMGRNSPVHLYAPANYHEMMLSHLSDFDIHLGFEIDFIALSGENSVRILDDKYLTVTSFPLDHRVSAYGFLFREKPSLRNIRKEAIEQYEIPSVRIPAIKKGEDFIAKDGSVIKNGEITIPGPKQLSYAYCSDTKYFSRLPGFIKDTDLLYHEATFDKSLSELASMTGHSTTIDAARIAREAGAGALLIGHFSARYRDINALVNEARSVFLQTFPAIDGRTYEVGNISEP
jgi:ribonuclease Z